MLDKLQPPENVDGDIMDLHDRGWRKFFLVMFCISLVSAGAILNHYWDNWDHSFDAWSGTLVEILAIYVIGNVGYKGIAGFVNGKYGQSGTAAKNTPQGNG